MTGTFSIDQEEYKRIFKKSVLQRLKALLILMCVVFALGVAVLLLGVFYDAELLWYGIGLTAFVLLLVAVLFLSLNYSAKQALKLMKEDDLEFEYTLNEDSIVIKSVHSANASEIDKDAVRSVSDAGKFYLVNTKMTTHFLIKDENTTAYLQCFPKK